jgi:hypothetical protein
LDELVEEILKYFAFVGFHIAFFWVGWNSIVLTLESGLERRTASSDCLRVGITGPRQGGWPRSKLRKNRDVVTTPSLSPHWGEDGPTTALICKRMRDGDLEAPVSPCHRGDHFSLQRLALVHETFIKMAR